MSSKRNWMGGSRKRVAETRKASKPVALPPPPPLTADDEAWPELVAEQVARSAPPAPVVEQRSQDLAMLEMPCPLPVFSSSSSSSSSSSDVEEPAATLVEPAAPVCRVGAEEFKCELRRNFFE